MASADSGAPFSGIEAFGCLLAFPHINTARNLAVARADELLAMKAWDLEEIRSDLREMRPALLEADGRRQVIEDDGGGMSPAMGKSLIGCEPQAFTFAIANNRVFRKPSQRTAELSLARIIRPRFSQPWQQRL